MARIRTIKPDFWTDEKIVELSAFARLLFIGLWNFADDEGRMECSPRKIKMQIFPADNLDILELLGELRREKLVVAYFNGGKEYIAITGFSKHQKIDKRTSSKLPSPEESQISPELPRIVPTEGKGREGKGREGSKLSCPSDTRHFEPEKVTQFSLSATLPNLADDVPEAVSDWNAMAVKHGLTIVQKITTTRKSRLLRRLADCGGIGGWADAIAKVPKSPFLLGVNDTGWKADFDFMLQEKSFTKLMEGAYDRTNGNHPADDTAERKRKRREAILVGLAPELATRNAASTPDNPGDGGIGETINGSPSHTSEP